METSIGSICFRNNVSQVSLGLRYQLKKIMNKVNFENYVVLQISFFNLIKRGEPYKARDFYVVMADEGKARINYC